VEKRSFIAIRLHFENILLAELGKLLKFSDRVSYGYFILLNTIACNRKNKFYNVLITNLVSDRFVLFCLNEHFCNFKRQGIELS